MAGIPRFQGEVPAGQSYCTKCERCLPVEVFPAMPRKKNGLDSWCRPCRAKSAHSKRREQPGGWRDYYLRSTFGITEKHFLELLSAQGGGCGICGTTMPWSAKASLQNFSVDHDHDCCPGKKCCGRCVRGLLCNRCNRGLGQFGDDAVTLRRAIAYLTASRLGGDDQQMEAAKHG